MNKSVLLGGLAASHVAVFGIGWLPSKVVRLLSSM
jgi:hypothetical protein